MSKELNSAADALVFDYVYHFQSPTHMAIKLVKTKRLIKALKNKSDTDVETFNKICEYCNWLRNVSRSLSYNLQATINYYHFVQMQNKLNNPINALDITTPFVELTRFQKVRRYFYYVDTRSHGLLHYHPRTNTPMDEYLYDIIKYDHRLLKIVDMFKKFRQVKASVDFLLQ